MKAESTIERERSRLWRLLLKHKAAGIDSEVFARMKQTRAAIDALSWVLESGHRPPRLSAAHELFLELKRDCL